MAHIYYIRSGEWYGPEGELLSLCHAGFGAAMNDPARCYEKNVGPLPPGFYDIGPAYSHPKLGKITMNLVPHPGTDMHGRDLMRVHGANKSPDPSDDSHGCVTMPRGPRALLALALDRVVEVVPERPESMPLLDVTIEAAFADLLRLEDIESTEIPEES
jgi:hypothetical protein